MAPPGQVGEGAGLSGASVDVAGAAASRWRFAATLLPWLLAGVGLLNSVYGWVRSDATGAADSRYAAKHAVEFETSADNRLKEAWARMDQIDRDRESRTVIINKTVADLGDVLRSQIDGVNRKLDQRSETRTAEVNTITQRLGNIELKLCVLSGLKVSQCK